jgi:DNA mismatch repair protein MutL
VDLSFNPFDQMPGQEEWAEPKERFVTPGPTGGLSRFVEKNDNYGALFEDRTLPTSQILIVQGKYILSQSAGGIMAVNIRRAQERLLHDRFLKALTANAHVSQAALFPVQVPVGVEGRLLIEEHAELLRSLGFDIAPFGNDTVVVSGVPEGYSAQQGVVEGLLADILLILKDEHHALPGVMEQNLAQQFAVLGACSASPITSPLEAQRLLDALLQSENPEFTSAGKRIIAIIPAEDLEKRF